MLNKAVLVGRLTADPELKQTVNGINYTNFSIAINRAYTPKGTERQTDFINIIAWRATAEFVCKYFLKGNMIGIDGSIQTRHYDDKDGNKRTAFEVVAENVSFVESKKDDASKTNNTTPAINEPMPAYSSGSIGDFQVIGHDDDDLPF